jgi:xylulose-5-phosphate/fructose-6-phosphate phosphoketolase
VNVRVPKLAVSAAYVKQFVRDTRVEHKEYIERRGEDVPEIRDWKWGTT